VESTCGNPKFLLKTFKSAIALGAWFASTIAITPLPPLGTVNTVCGLQPGTTDTSA